MSKPNAPRAAMTAPITALFLAPVGSAWAHPGHGDETSLAGLAHLLEPVHLLPVLLLVAVGWLLRRRARRAADERRRQDLPRNLR
jgi:hypothetical protein